MNINNLDDIVEKLNGFGKYQKIRYFLICLSGFFPPISSFMHSFIAASPAYRLNSFFFKTFVIIVLLSLYLYLYFNSCLNSTFDKGLNDSIFLGLDYYYTEEYQYKCYSVIDKFDENTTKCTSWHFDKTNYQSTLTEDVSQLF